MLPLVQVNTVLLGGAFSSVLGVSVTLVCLSALAKFLLFDLMLGFVWQWMADGPHGVSGRPAGPSAHTGAEGSAQHQPPRMEARTAMASSYSPRTARMGCACRVSLLEQSADAGEL